MSKYETQEIQQEALRILGEYDINRVQEGLRVDDPLEGIVFIQNVDEISKNVTVVAKSTVVDGDISSTSPLAIRGTVNGNIITTSDIGINGLINGDIEAENIDFSHAAIKGNSKAVRSVNLGSQSVVIGDISGNKVTIDGKVKGNVLAVNSLYFKSSALMVGSVTAGGISTEDGSRINASITLTNKESEEFDDSEFDLEV